MCVRVALNLGLVLGLVSSSLAAAPESPVKLDVFPPKVRLKGPEASQRFVVLGEFADGTTRDVTDRITLESGKGGFVRVEGNAVRPAHNGAGLVIVRVGKASTAVRSWWKKPTSHGWSASRTRSPRF